MKKKKTALQNLGLLLFTALAFVACDKDFSAIGTDIIGEDNFGTTSETFPVITYNIETGDIQSNGLASNLLGYYYDPAFGGNGMTSSYVGQMILGNSSSPAFDPIFGEGPKLDSVVVTLPLFSRVTEVNDDGESTYELDSVYGTKKIKLSIYQNNFFLRDFDPNGDFDDELGYFTDGSLSDGSTVPTGDLEGTLLYQNTDFQPSDAQIVLMTPELDDDGNQIINDDGFIAKEESNRISPAIRIRLDKQEYADHSTHTLYTSMMPDNYWENLFFNKEGQPELSNPNNFANYFRGLYFQAEAVNPTEGSMMMLNFTSGNVTIHYSNDADDGDNDGDEIPNYADADFTGEDQDSDGINDAYDVNPTENNNQLNDNGKPYNEAIIGSGSLVMNFNNSSVNFVDASYSEIPVADTTNGDAQLYLKGGADGNMAIVELFEGANHDDDVDPTENAFEAFRNEFVELDENDEFVKSKRLVNEANLIFYVDQDMIQGSEPDRLYIYDLKNDVQLIDYVIDLSIDPDNGDNKILHLEPLTRVDDDPHGDGIKYKIRITEHINNILIRDSTNIRLGLTVTSSVNSINNRDIKGFQDDDEGIFPKSATTGQFLSPKGTILYGNNAIDPTKRVELEIFYTEPNEN